MTTAADIAEQANKAFAELTELTSELKNAKEADRFNSLTAAVEAQGQAVAELKQKQADAEAQEAQKATLDRLTVMVENLGKDVRSPSKAHLIGSGREPEPSTDNFLRLLAMAQSSRTPIEARQRAEKALVDMGSTWQDVPEYSKATLGTTDATGGYIAPKPFVAELQAVGVANNPYRSLLTVVTGINAPSLEIPHVGLAPTRAAVVARGETKPNVGVVMSNYTATFFTLAQIHDAANQWLRQTGGAGERLIRQRLGEAMALGESWYILNGVGTTEPKGLLTSIGTSGDFVTTHTAAQTTIAGNIASGIAKAAGALANRSRTPNGAVMNAGDFWIVLASGDNSAGFYINPTGGAADVNAIGAFSNGAPAIRLWGIPLYADPNMPADSLVLGDWKSAELYLGEGYRVDTSTEAGDRWDKNLTGFRAEEEIAFNADPYVAAGMFQRLIDTKA